MTRSVSSHDFKGTFTATPCHESDAEDHDSTLIVS